MYVNWSFSSLFKNFRHLNYRLLYWSQYLNYIRYIQTCIQKPKQEIKAVCYGNSTVRRSQLQTSNYVTFLQVRNMVTSHWLWYGSSTSRKWMSQYSSMSATCRLHTETSPATLDMVLDGLSHTSRRLELLNCDFQWTVNCWKYTEEITTR